jgi:acetoin:2,6-dichlorophenolindophenol oxidoreductase subunit alpha
LSNLSPRVQLGKNVEGDTMAWDTPLDETDTYRTMVRMRLVDEALVAAWADGLVPGEYHSGIGEEAINAGVIAHLADFDAMALDHRNTAPLIARGADPELLMLEVMGSTDGMNHGHAGHMHLMDPNLHAAADGIVGSSGPLAVGHAIALAQLHPGRIAVAFHGEGAMNQGMLLESYNLAVAWNLPVVFVCKDNSWSITTHSSEVTGGDVVDRARAFGLAVEDVRGDRVEDVYRAASRLVNRARKGGGPGFLHATCHRPGGHFEGDPLVRILEHPRTQAADLAPGIIDSLRNRSGGTWRSKARGITVLTKRGTLAARDWILRSRREPIDKTRRIVDAGTAGRIEAQERAAIDTAIVSARDRVGRRPTFGTSS